MALVAGGAGKSRSAVGSGVLVETVLLNVSATGAGAVWYISETEVLVVVGADWASTGTAAFEAAALRGATTRSGAPIVPEAKGLTLGEGCAAGDVRRSGTFVGVDSEPAAGLARSFWGSVATGAAGSWLGWATGSAAGQWRQVAIPPASNSKPSSQNQNTGFLRRWVGNSWLRICSIAFQPRSANFFSELYTLRSILSGYYLVLDKDQASFPRRTKSWSAASNRTRSFCRAVDKCHFEVPSLMSRFSAISACE